MQFYINTHNADTVRHVLEEDGNFRGMAGVFGEETLFKLMDAHGGDFFDFPDHEAPKESRQYSVFLMIADIIGKANAIKLCKSGYAQNRSTLWIPKTTLADRFLCIQLKQQLAEAKNCTLLSVESLEHALKNMPKRQATHDFIEFVGLDAAVKLMLVYGHECKTVYIDAPQNGSNFRERQQSYQKLVPLIGLETTEKISQSQESLSTGSIAIPSPTGFFRWLHEAVIIEEYEKLIADPHHLKPYRREVDKDLPDDRVAVGHINDYCRLIADVWKADYHRVRQLIEYHLIDKQKG